MKDTELQELGKLTQVAQELHRLADSIGRGKIHVSGIELTISDSVTLKIKQKMTGTKVIFDLKIQALIEADSNKPKGKATKKKTEKGNSRPYGMKALKKKYTSVWRVIATQVKKGEKPDGKTVDDLHALSSEYAEYAPPEWSAMWSENEVLIRKCIDCALENDFAQAGDILHEINKAKKRCHKMYK